MPRRYIIPVSEVYKRRAAEFEYHYNNHRTVQEVFVMYDPYRVNNTLRREIPEPIMRADGSLIEGIKTVQGKARAADLLNIGPMQKDLMCLWYWSEDGWADFNRQYQNLPDVTEDYCLRYDEENDAVLLVPVSDTPRVAGGHTGIIAYDPEEAFLPRTRNKSGTSRVHLG